MEENDMEENDDEQVWNEDDIRIAINEAMGDVSNEVERLKIEIDCANAATDLFMDLSKLAERKLDKLEKREKVLVEALEYFATPEFEYYIFGPRQSAIAREALKRVEGMK